MAHFGATFSHRAELQGTTALAAVAMLIGRFSAIRPGLPIDPDREQPG
jgi:hypothetical protein